MFTVLYQVHKWFSVLLLFREVNELIISIIQARDLTPNQYSGTLDTYIRGVVLPDQDTKFQTKVIILSEPFYIVPSPVIDKLYKSSVNLNKTMINYQTKPENIQCLHSTIIYRNKLLN